MNKKIWILFFLALLVVVSLLLINRVRIEQPPKAYSYEVVFSDSRIEIDRKNIDNIVNTVSNQYYKRLFSRPMLITGQFTRISIRPNSDAVFTAIDIYLNETGDSFIAYGSTDLKLDKDTAFQLMLYLK